MTPYIAPWLWNSRFELYLICYCKVNIFKVIGNIAKQVDYWNPLRRSLVTLVSRRIPKNWKRNEFHNNAFKITDTVLSSLYKMCVFFLAFKWYFICDCIIIISQVITKRKKVTSYSDIYNIRLSDCIECVINFNKVCNLDFHILIYYNQLQALCARPVGFMLHPMDVT